MNGPVMMAGALMACLCVIQRRSPARMLLVAGLHMRAVWMMAGIVRRAVAAVLPRYAECVDAAKREVL